MPDMHWKTLIDDDAVYLLGEVDGQPVALKVSSCEHMPHEELAAIVASTLNIAVDSLSAVGRVSQAIVATNEARAK